MATDVPRTIAPSEWQAVRPVPPRAASPQPGGPRPIPPQPVPAHREQRVTGVDLWRAQSDRAGRHEHFPPRAAHGEHASPGSDLNSRRVEDRVRVFRRNLVGYGATSGFLFVINMVTTPFFPWFLFPTLGMGVGVARQWGGLWADGVSARQIFGRKTADDRTDSSLASGTPTDEGGAALSPELLAGPHGVAVRRAIEHRISIATIIAALPVEDRALLPEIMPTVDALVARAGSLAAVLHRLDTDCSPGLLVSLDDRIAKVEQESDTAPDHDRRLALLQRQRTTIRELLERRETVARQAESVTMTLENLKLDLLKLRSSGVRNALNDVSSATQEARALSRDLGYLLDAAKEVREL